VKDGDPGGYPPGFLFHRRLPAREGSRAGLTPAPQASTASVVTPQVIAHQDARRLIAHLRQRGGRRGAAAIDVAGAENMSGQVCPSCGQTTALLPSAPPAESIRELIPKLAAVPFSHQAARDADEGRPVMVTGAVPEQVAAYQLIAERIGHQLGRT
jgi:hypothetical protein